MVCDAEEELLHASVVVHVRVTLYIEAQEPAVVTSTNETVYALLHASDTTGVAKDGVAGQLIVDGAGNEAMDGADIS